MRTVSFFDMARSTDVKRWHIINTTRPQTMAEHGFMTALIALQLSELLQTTGSMFDSPREQFMFLCAALYHDMPETIYGDPPTPAKHVFREFVQNLRLFDELDMVLMPNIPYAGGLLSPKLGQIIKMSDLIEAYHFLCNNASGLYAKTVRDDLWKRILDMVGEMQYANGDWLVAPAVGSVLKDLGLTHRADDIDTAPLINRHDKDPRI